MKKKVILFVVMFTLIFTLIGCTGKFSKEDFLTINLGNTTAEKTPLNDVELYKIANAVAYDDTQLYRGLVIVSFNTDVPNPKSVYSLIAGKLLFTPKSGITINVFQRDGFTYVELVNTDNEKIVYDILGNIVLAEKKYESYTITGKVETEFDDDGIVVKKIYKENILYSYLDNNDELVEKLVKSQVDIETRERTRLTEEEIDDYIDLVNNFDFKFLGLPGYHGVQLNNNIFVYKTKDNKLVNSFVIRDGAVLAGFNGKLLIEKVYEVDPEINKDYTFYDEDDDAFYILQYETIDLLTGKIKKWKTDFVIQGMDTFRDSKGVVKYGVAEVQDIVNKSITGVSYYAVLDDKGNIIKDYGTIDIFSLDILYDDYFYDYDSEFLLNNNLEPIFEVPNYNGYYRSERLIVNGRNFLNDLGVIDYSGKIIVPFKHSYLDRQFFNNKIVAVDDEDNLLLYDKEGVKTKLEENYYRLTPGLLVKDNETSIEIIDYNLKRVLLIDEVDGYGDNSFRIVTLFGNFVVESINKMDNTNEYLFIDVTAK